jgi:hypothetical protein
MLVIDCDAPNVCTTYGLQINLRILPRSQRHNSTPFRPVVICDYSGHVQDVDIQSESVELRGGSVNATHNSAQLVGTQFSITDQ